MTGMSVAGKAGTRKCEDKVRWPYLISHPPVRRGSGLSLA